MLVFLGLISFSLSPMSVLAQEESEPIPSTDKQEQDTTGDNEKFDPWKPQKLGGVAIGENAALAIPTSILFMIFLIFVGIIGYAIYMIFESDRQRIQKEEEKQIKRELKKNSKKKKNH
jgi:hypothetical protein